MKRHFFMLIMALVMVVLFLGGCSSKSTAPTSEEKQAESSTSAPISTPAETYSWIAITTFPSGHNANHSVEEFVRKLEESTNGAVKITLHKGTLGEPNEFWDMVKSNTVQLAFTGDTYNLSRMPITNMLNLPLEVPSPRAGLLVLDAWLKNGYLQELTDNFKILYFRSVYPITLFFRDKKVTSIDDLKGLKVRGVAGIQNMTVSALGATPIAMPRSEVYMSLDRKVIDGVMTGIDNAVDSKLYEVTKYALKMPFNVGSFVLLMNKETWDSLPSDLQSTIDQIAEDVSTAELQIAEVEESNYWDTYGKYAEVYTLSEEEEEKWCNAVANVVNNYVEETAAKGYPAREALELMRNVVSDYLKNTKR